MKSGILWDFAFFCVVLRFLEKYLVIWKNGIIFVLEKITKDESN